MKLTSQWFNGLPMPYKIQALNNFNIEGDCFRPSLYNALEFGFEWRNSTEKYPYWAEVALQIAQGKITWSPIPDIKDYDWSNAPEWAKVRFITESGQCKFGGYEALNGQFKHKTRIIRVLSDMTGIDWKETFEIKPI